jgi:hypothetical protein
LVSKDGVGGVGLELFKLYAKPLPRNIPSILNILEDLLEKSAERIRIQNLRFAYLLCVAQRVSTAIKI